MQDIPNGSGRQGMSHRSRLPFSPARQINEAANRSCGCCASAGLKEGDAVALLCSNRAEFVEVLAAACAAAIASRR
jgi:non-ribosomal peptide synthetase component E (peptide arylation enzyme)